MNKTILIGNLTRDPRISMTSSGPQTKRFANFPDCLAAEVVAVQDALFPHTQPPHARRRNRLIAPRPVVQHFHHDADLPRFHQRRVLPFQQLVRCLHHVLHLLDCRQRVLAGGQRFNRRHPHSPLSPSERIVRHFVDFFHAQLS